MLNKEHEVTKNRRKLLSAFLISNVKILLNKNTAQYIGNVLKRQKTSRNQITMIKQNRKGKPRKRW